MARPVYPALETGQYLFDPHGGPTGGPVYITSPADAGEALTATLSYRPNYLYTTELYTIPPGASIIVNHGGLQQITKADGSTSNSVIFQNDAGVAYYPSGTALTSEGEGGTPTAAGQYGWTNSNGYGTYTFDSADIGKEVVIRYLYLNPDYQTFAAQFSEAILFAAGIQGQAVSAYMASEHPDQSVGYSLTALAELDAGYIGMSGALPDYTYEVQGFGIVGGGNQDAEPVGCIETILTDPFVGVGFPAQYIDQASWFNSGNAARNWTQANSLFLSEAIKNPEAAQGIIGRWLKAFNVAAVWSEGLLKLVPYGDQAVGTYAPNTAVVAALDDDDFLPGDSSDPVQADRTPWADAYNRVQVNYRNRSNSYNTDLVYEQDEASVARFGLRIKGAETFDFVTTWQTASAVANMLLKRGVLVRNAYQFKLPVTFEYLEPMDLVSLSDSRLGLDGQVVRVTKVTNSTDGSLSVECEEWPGNGYAMPVTNPKAAVPPLHPQSGTASAGQTAAVILQASNAAPGQTGTRIYIWAAPAQVTEWGGCSVYVSMDGSSYEPIGAITSPAPIYTLQAELASVAAAPSGALGLTHDATDTILVAGSGGGFQVQTTAGLAAWSPGTQYAAGDAAAHDGSPWVAVNPNSGSEPTAGNQNWQQIPSAVSPAPALASVSETAAAALANLAAVISLSGGAPSAVEFLSFATVSAGTAPNELSLSDLYRGALGTAIGSFPTGSQLVLFSGASLHWDVPAGLSGQKVYFRFVAWNQKGSTTQSVDLADDVPFTVGAPGAIGVWEGLTGPVASVVTPSGELIVDPPAGVVGNLPLANHAVSVQTGAGAANAGLNSSGHVIVGTVATPVASLDSGASRANAAIDATNIVVAAGLDLSRGYTNKYGAYIPRASGDATTLDRAFAKGSATDPDTLDSVGDGTTYARHQIETNNENIVANGNFAAGLAGWTLYSASPTLVSTTDPFGTTRNVVQVSGEGWVGLKADFNSPCAPGDTFVWDFWIKTGGAGNWALYYADQPDASFYNPGAPTVWTHVVVQHAIPSGADDSYHLKFGCVNGQASPSDWAQFTAISIRKVRGLDNDVADGTTYVRYVGADATGNRLDFGKSLLNKYGSNLPRSSSDATTLDRAFAKGSAGDADTLDSVADGTTYVRPKYVDSDNTFHASTALNNQGSVPPNSFSGSVVASISGTTITVTVTGGTIYRPDGSTISVPSSAPTFTTWNGVAIAYPSEPGSGTNYNNYYGSAVWDIATGAVVVLQQSGPTNTSSSSTAVPVADTVGAYQDGYIGLLVGFDMQTTMTSSGGGGGGGGGGYTSCPTEDQVVESQCGTIPARDLRSGDRIMTPRGWEPATIGEPFFEEAIRATFTDGNSITVNEAHFVFRNGQPVLLAGCVAGDEVDGLDTTLTVASIEHIGQRRIIPIEVPGTTYCLGPICHNVTPINYCPTDEQPVFTRDHGVLAARDVKTGMLVDTPRGWEPVTVGEPFRAPAYRVDFTDGGSISAHERHIVYQDGRPVQLALCHAGQEIGAGTVRSVVSIGERSIIPFLVPGRTYRLWTGVRSW